MGQIIVLFEMIIILPVCGCDRYLMYGFCCEQVRDTVMGKEWIDPSKNQSFFSLPPSPSNRSYLS